MTDLFWFEEVIAAPLLLENRFSSSLSPSLNNLFRSLFADTDGLRGEGGEKEERGRGEGREEKEGGEKGGRRRREGRREGREGRREGKRKRIEEHCI